MRMATSAASAARTAYPDFGSELLPLEKQAAVLRGTGRAANLGAGALPA
jgi:hypothetical protein